MKTNKKIYSLALASAVLVLVLILFSSMASAAAEKSAYPNITITQITTSGIATRPDIYGDKIVWEEDYSNGYASNIHVYNLSTQEEETEFGASGSPSCPVIYDNTIVWKDCRNGYRDHKQYISSSDIYMYDLSTGKETLITEPPRNAGSQDIYGNRIVWEDGTNNVNIYMYDISTHYLHNINQLGTWRSSINPAIYGDRVVYQDGRNGYPQIFMYNNSTQTEIQISSKAGLNPAIYGDRIVWQDSTQNNGNIHMYDLSTSQETQITTSGSASDPAIYGDRIVWEDYRKLNPDIYMYDLSTSQETRITTSGLVSSPAIYDNRIIWSYGRYRASDIYMATISEEPELKTPVANFTSSVTSGKAPVYVKFTDTSTGSPTFWFWNFGDGSKSYLQNPTHKYSKAGTYTVNLTVKNAAGRNTVTKTEYIKVVTKPVANFTSSVTSGIVPLKVTFTDTSTGSPTFWFWDFGDGSKSYQQNPTHKYSNAGIYTVNLTVKNAVGRNTVTKTGYINVVTKPVANFTSSVTSGIVPLKVTFTDTSTGTPVAWKWDFGDGSKSYQQNPTHKYSNVGTYTVNLTVKNAIGRNTVTKTEYIKVVTKPVANFTSSVTSGTVPLKVTFTDTSTGTPSGWKWDFGDGSKSYLQNPTHKYSNVGTYTVNLTVKNAIGRSTVTKTEYIKVIT